MAFNRQSFTRMIVDSSASSLSLLTGLRPPDSVVDVGTRSMKCVSRSWVCALRFPQPFPPRRLVLFARGRTCLGKLSPARVRAVCVQSQVLTLNSRPACAGVSDVVGRPVHVDETEAAFKVKQGESFRRVSERHLVGKWLAWFF